MNVSGKLWFLGHILRYSKSYSQSTSVVSRLYLQGTSAVHLGIPLPGKRCGVQQLSGENRCRRKKKLYLCSWCQVFMKMLNPITNLNVSL